MKKKSVLVIGIGRFGRGVIEGLAERGHDVFAIDKDEEALDDIRDKIVSGAILDAGEDDDELAKLVEEKNFDEAVVALGADFEGAIIATTILKEADIYVSVKAANTRKGNALKKMGADRVVFPERDMGRRLAHMISIESEIDVLDLPEGLIVERLKVGDGLAGRAIGDLDSSNRLKVWVLLVYQKNGPIQPEASTILKKGDIIIVYGEKSKILMFENENLGK